MNSAPSNQIVVVLNPAAGRGRGRQRRPLLESLLAQEAAQRATRWEIVETTRQGEATHLAQEAVRQGATTVVAAGGDGTCSEVVNGIVGMDVRFGVIPVGTGNDFCRTLGVGTDIQKAIKTLFHGTPHRIDLGQMGARWFLNTAGCGFDALVAERVNRGFRNLHGTAAYLAAVLQTLRTFQAVSMRLTLDGETQEVRAMMCSVCNAKMYGGGMRIAPDAQIDDGLFDICLLREAGKGEFLRAFPRVFRGTHVTHPKVAMFRARHVQVACDPPMPVLVDGEIVGTTPVEFTLSPRALEVISP